ncbi:MAG: hypothetical protein AB7H97_15480, partial [Pseudobdellovibrionaceae bacterium]
MNRQQTYNHHSHHHKKQKAQAHALVSAYSGTIWSRALVAILIFLCTLWSFSVRAEELVEDEQVDSDGWVEVEMSPTVMTRDKDASSIIPYTHRKYDWGWQIGFGSRAFKPEFYRSGIDQSTYENAYSEGGQMGELEVGVRYNTSAGGFLFNLGYAVGDISSHRSRDPTTIDPTYNRLAISQTLVGLKFVVDSFWLEPYIAPYFGGGLASTTYKEQIFAVQDGPSTGSDSGKAAGAFYNFG